MNAPIYYIGGSKGGVGKSIVAFAFIDYLIGKGIKVLLVETDNSNPDVYKAHNPYAGESLICEINDLDSSDGWIKLVDYAEEHPEHWLVINSAARSNTGIAQYGATLRETLGGLERQLAAFWLLNRQRDSVELLRSFLTAFPEIPIWVFRNLFFGSMERFDVYNTSKIKEQVEKRGRTLDLPNLAARVADRIYSERLPLWIAMTKFRLSERYELSRWKNLCSGLFDIALEGKLS